MALLVTVKETNAFVKGGIMERENVNLLLKNPRLPSEFMEQVDSFVKYSSLKIGVLLFLFSSSKLMYCTGLVIYTLQTY